MSNYIKHYNNLLLSKIPAAECLDFKITDYKNNYLTISAPLELNNNDKNTGFAGSLFSAAALTGWCLLNIKFIEKNIDIKSAMYTANIKFAKPIKKDFYSTCILPEPDEWDIFFNRVLNKKNGKISLNIKIYSENNQDNPEACMETVFYAWLDKQDSF